MYLASDVLRNRKQYFIGVTTVFFSVCFTAFLYSSILNTSPLFMKIAENQVGEPDFRLVKRITNESISPFINYSAIEKSLTRGGFPSAPRWLALADVRSKRDPKKKAATVVIAADLKAEKNIGFGRQWPYRTLGQQETYISSSALYEMGIDANHGERVILSLDMIDLLDTLTTSGSHVSIFFFHPTPTTICQLIPSYPSVDDSFN